tara:strand:- start:275 stop:607 length:333 start_codon:yes stop_codon:yes gene_type:complete
MGTALLHNNFLRNSVFNLMKYALAHKSQHPIDGGTARQFSMLRRTIYSERFVASTALSLCAPVSTIETVKSGQNQLYSHKTADWIIITNPCKIDCAGLKAHIYCFWKAKI